MDAKPIDCFLLPPPLQLSFERFNPFDCDDKLIDNVLPILGEMVAFLFEPIKLPVAVSSNKPDTTLLFGDFGDCFPFLRLFDDSNDCRDTILILGDFGECFLFL